MTSVVDLEQFRRKPAASLAGEPHPAKKLEASQAEAQRSRPAEKTSSPRAPTKTRASSTEKKPQATTPVATGQTEPRLTKPAREFRTRFLAALEELKREAFLALSQAQTRADIKAKINVSLVLKRAKASPLTAYSPLHRDTLLPLVDAAAGELANAISEQFTSEARAGKVSLSSLRSELTQSRATFEKQLSTLASQKLSAYITQS